MRILSKTSCEVLSTKLRNVNFTPLLRFENVTRSQSSFVSFLKDWRQSPVPLKMHRFEKDLMEPLNYYLRAPAPLNGALIKCYNHWLKVPEEKLAKLESILNVLAENLVMFDDLTDSSPIRRGMPSSHILHGFELTAICGVFNYFQLQQSIFEHTNYDREIISSWVTYLTNFFRAEGYEKVWARNNYCPTEAEFLSNMMLRVKSHGEFAIDIVQRESSVKTDFKPSIAIFTSYFQLRDDYESLFMPEEYFKQRETFAEDLTLGKFSFPVVHAIRGMKNKDIEEILRLKTSDIDIKRRAVSILKDIGTMDYCKEILEECHQEVEREMALLGPNPLMDMCLFATKDWEDPTSRSNINYVA